MLDRDQNMGVRGGENKALCGWLQVVLSLPLNVANKNEYSELSLKLEKLLN